MRTLALLGFTVESAVWHYVLGTSFCTTILDWTVLEFRILGTIVILYLFCLYITPVITVSESFGGYLID